MSDLANVNARLVNMRAEGSKELYAQLSVFRNPKMKEAKFSLGLFSSEKRGAPLMEVVFSRAWIEATRLHWQNLLASNNAGDKVVAVVTKRERTEDRQMKSVKVGSITYGIDQGGRAFIGLSDGSVSAKLPLYPDSNFTYREELKPEDNNRAAVAAWLSYVDAGLNIVNECLKVPAERDDNGGGRGGGGGNWKGRNNGGGNRSYGGGNGGGNKNDLDDEIAF